MGYVNGPAKDAAKNVGKTTINFLAVDIYRPRANTRSIFPVASPRMPA